MASIDAFGGMLRWKGGSAMNSSSNQFSTVDKTHGSFVNLAHASTKWAVRPATGKSILQTKEGLTFRPKMKLLSLRGSCWGGGERLDLPVVEEAEGPAKELFTREAVLTWEMSSLTNSVPKRSSPPIGSFSAARDRNYCCNWSMLDIEAFEFLAD